jgi:hypothetical protein
MMKVERTTSSSRMRRFSRGLIIAYQCVGQKGRNIGKTPGTDGLQVTFEGFHPV